MKILIFRTYPGKVNINTYNLQEIGLAKALIRKGHVCDVAYYGGNEKDYSEEITFDEDKKVKILWLRGLNIMKDGIYPTFKKYIDDYDIIHVCEYIGVMSAWLNRNYSHKVVNYQGPYYSDYCTGAMRKAKIQDNTLLRLVDRSKMIVGTKSSLATEYMNSKGINNTMTIGVGLDISNLNSAGDDIQQNETVKSILSKLSDRTLLYIGTIRDLRNTKFLIDVLNRIKEIDNNNEYRLIIIGKGDPVYTEECKQKISELGLDDNVIWHDSLEQKYLKALYEVADVFVIPTKFEIYGMVILESMYFGVPVVTTYNGGSSTMMNEDNGIVLDLESSDRWADEIVTLLNDKERYDNMCKNAHDTVVNGYTWDVLADKFLELYNSRISSEI